MTAAWPQFVSIYVGHSPDFSGRRPRFLFSYDRFLSTKGKWFMNVCWKLHKAAAPSELPVWYRTDERGRNRIGNEGWTKRRQLLDEVCCEFAGVLHYQKRTEKIRMEKWKKVFWKLRGVRLIFRVGSPAFLIPILLGLAIRMRRRHSGIPTLFVNPQILAFFLAFVCYMY